MTYLSHTFTGADSTLTPGTADTGQAPLLVQIGTGAVWGRIGNQAYLATAGTDYSFLHFDTTAANGTLRCLMYTHDQSTGLCFRITDASNLFMVEQTSVAASPGDFTLYRRQAGAWNTIGTASGIVRASGDPMSVVLNGASIAVQINGVSIITVSDSFNSTATKHGMAHKGPTSSTRYDNLTFTG